MIKLDNVTVRAGEFSLAGVSLEVPAGAYGVLMGKTGSGKTTLLEAVAGLARARRGNIVLDGRNVTRLRPAARGIGYVPQDVSLFEGMTVADHIAYALEIRKVGREDIRARVAELSELLGIGDLLKRRPRGLSGGERQRVALGRALSFRPRILLLDEPLSALDERTREQMYDLLKDVRAHTQATCLHVTHNGEEAGRLADCAFTIEDGKVRTGYSFAT